MMGSATILTYEIYINKEGHRAFRSGQWILDNGINGAVDRQLQYGPGTDIPIGGGFNNG
jgi:hypothetical protein